MDKLYENSEKMSKILQDSNIPFGIMEFSQIPKLIECRAKSRLPQNPQTVISCLFPYNVGEQESRNVSKYAVIPDYHSYISDTLGKICIDLSSLYNGEFVYFSDISPIPEVFCATKSGLGVRGKNNLLITKKYGSYVFIGEIVTTIKFKPSIEENDNCIGCGKCQKSCPNFAIGQLSIDYTRCVSTISQKKGELTPQEKQAMKKSGLVWGCDLCQECCPHNKQVSLTSIGHFLNDIKPTLTKENLKMLMQTRAYGYKGEVILKRNLEITQGSYSE